MISENLKGFYRSGKTSINKKTRVNSRVLQIKM